MIVALLSWWEESPAWLARCVAGVGRFADHLVAVDGAYGHVASSLKYARSGGEQIEAIAAAAEGCGMGLTIHAPTGPWIGDEVAKRSFMFRAGLLAARPGEDWFYVVDSDEMMVEVPSNLREQLDAAAEDGIAVGSVEWYERTTNQPVPGDNEHADRIWQHLTMRGCQQGMRKFFLADETIRVEGAHYVYVAGHGGDKRYLWGNASVHALEPDFVVSGMRFEHWSRMRQPARRQVQRDYYNLRDRLALETVRPPELDGVPEIARV